MIFLAFLLVIDLYLIALRRHYCLRTNSFNRSNWIRDNGLILLSASLPMPLINDR